MRLIILAAGEGKRLRPLTEKIPKCLVSLKGKSLLSHQLSSIKKCSVPRNKIALVGGYKSDSLDQFKLKVFKNPEYKTTNMVSTLFCASEFMKPDEDLIVSYGDIVYEDKVLKKLLNCDAQLSVVADRAWERLWRLRMDDPLDDAETFIMNADCSIKELGKKPTNYDQVQAQYIGLIKIRGDMVKKLKEIYFQMDRSITYDGQDFENLYMTSFIQYLIYCGWEVEAALIKNSWLEVDTVEDLESYELMPKNILDSYCSL